MPPLVPIDGTTIVDVCVNRGFGENSTGFAKHVVHIWGSGAAAEKRVFCALMETLQYIQWNVAYEYMVAHLATVMVSYNVSHVSLLERAMDPNKDTIKPDASNRRGTDESRAKRARI
jgi:hypothetical protein